MLTRLIRGAVVAAVAVALLALVQLPAQAGGGQGSGGPLGSVQCGQSYTPGCTVTAGTPGSSGTGSTGGTGTGAGTLAAAGPGGGCAGTVSKAFGCVPAGCAITVQTVACPVGVAGPPGGGNSGTPADDRRGSPRRPPHHEPVRFSALRAGTCRGERRRARNPGTSARHSRARAASGPAEWPPVRAAPPTSARRTAHSRTLRASPTSMTRARGEASRGAELM